MPTTFSLLGGLSCPHTHTQKKIWGILMDESLNCQSQITLTWIKFKRTLAYFSKKLLLYPENAYRSFTFPIFILN